MRLQNGDYLIVNKEGKRRLVQVVDEKPNLERGVSTVLADDTRFSKSAKVEIDVYEADFLANLGGAPSPGTAYGLRIDICYKVIDVPSWGQVHVYIPDMTKANLDTASAALSKVGAKLQKHGLFGFAPFETRWAPKRGKMAGSYAFKKDPHLDVLSLYQPAFETKQAFFHTAYHEAGHGIYEKVLGAKARARWVRLYHKYVERTQVGAQEVAQLTVGLSQASGAREWLKETEDKQLARLILKWVRDTHRLYPRDLDKLLAAGKPIDRILPTADDWKPILAAANVPVSDYASKNATEAFCEAFSFWMRGETLDPAFEDALERTVGRFMR